MSDAYVRRMNVYTNFTQLCVITVLLMAITLVQYHGAINVAVNDSGWVRTTLDGESLVIGVVFQSLGAVLYMASHAYYYGLVKHD